MKMFSEWRLWRQVLLIMGVVAVLFAYFAGELARYFEREKLQDIYERQINITANVLSATLLDAMIVRDIPVLETVAQQAGLTDKFIHSLSIKSPDGQMLVTWENPETGYAGELISVEREVSLQGQIFGRLQVTWDVNNAYSVIDREVQAFRYMVVGTMMALALILILSVQFIAVRPVTQINARLRGGLTENPEKGESVLSSYAARELHVLNRTITKLETEWALRRRREQELQDAHDHLEHRVKERTQRLEVLNNDLKDEIRERKDAEEKLKLTQTRLVQASKMEAVGTLAGGIAHEINTPSQYVISNLDFLDGAAKDFLSIIEAGDAVAAAAAAEKKHLLDEKTEALAALKDEVDYEFLMEEVPQAIHQTRHGMTQISNIVRSMKEFSHPVSKQKTAIDLNHLVERVSIISMNEWKHVANLVVDIPDSFPKIPILEGEFNQVLLNLIVNASYALRDKSPETGRITVSAAQEPGSVVIRVADNGRGIPEEVGEQIFDPFFTTKPVGEGSGQGLAISYDIIVNKHGGKIWHEPADGGGTAFMIRLPVA